MPHVAELVRGTWLDEALDAEVRSDAEALCHLLEGQVTNAALCLTLFDELPRYRPREVSPEVRQHEIEAEQARAAELAAENPCQSADPGERWTRAPVLTNKSAFRCAARSCFPAKELPSGVLLVVRTSTEVAAVASLCSSWRCGRRSSGRGDHGRWCDWHTRGVTPIATPARFEPSVECRRRTSRCRHGPTGYARAGWRSSA